ASHLRTTDLGKQIVDGSFDEFRNNPSSLIVGYRLAELLQAGIGDTIQLLSPGGEYWRFNVAAIARSGGGSIDSRRVYVQARGAPRLLKKPDETALSLFKIRRPPRAPRPGAHL